MQAIASLSRGVGVALQGVVRGVVRNQGTTEPARAGGTEPADSRLGDYLNGPLYDDVDGEGASFELLVLTLVLGNRVAPQS